MAYIEYSPCDELKKYVECFWTQIISASDLLTNSRTDKIVPDGCMDILFHLSSENESVSVSSALVIGTMTEAIEVQRDVSQILAVRFHPGGAIPFLKIKASEVKDTAIELSSIFGDRISQLLDLISSQDSMLGRKTLLEKFLLKTLSQSKCKNVVLPSQFLAQSEELPTVDQIVNFFGKSSRQIERLFHAHVGIGPKMFLRVKRFQSVDRWLRNKNRIQNDLIWSDVAVKHGYFDQAHLIRDCKEFTGLTPDNYRNFVKVSVFSNPGSQKLDKKTLTGGIYAI